MVSRGTDAPPTFSVPRPRTTLSPRVRAYQLEHHRLHLFTRHGCFRWQSGLVCQRCHPRHGHRLSRRPHRERSTTPDGGRRPTGRACPSGSSSSSPHPCCRRWPTSGTRSRCAWTRTRTSSPRCGTRRPRHGRSLSSRRCGRAAESRWGNAAVRGRGPFWAGCKECGAASGARPSVRPGSSRFPPRPRHLRDCLNRMLQAEQAQRAGKGGAGSGGDGTGSSGTGGADMGGGRNL